MLPEVLRSYKGKRFKRRAFIPLHFELKNQDFFRFFMIPFS